MIITNKDTIDRITSAGGALVHVKKDGRKHYYQIWTLRLKDLPEIVRIVNIALKIKRTFVTDDLARTATYSFDSSGYGVHQVVIENAN